MTAENKKKTPHRAEPFFHRIGATDWDRTEDRGFAVLVFKVFSLISLIVFFACIIVCIMGKPAWLLV